MGEIDLIFYVPPVLFSIVTLAFVLLWQMKITPAWQWSAGFAQTAAGFVVSTFLTEPYSAAFASGLIFIGAAYCYGSGLLVHFNAPRLRIPRVLFAAAYSVVLTYIVFVEQSLVQQLFLTDVGFALLLGVAVLIVTRRASRPIDIALVVTSSIVVLDSLTRAVFFTFFTNSSDDFGDFATSLYNLEVSVSTITVCMFFPFTALGASASAAIERHRAAAETDELTGLLNRRGFKQALERDFNTGGLSGSLLVCDIDHFKRINDTFGHAVGDTVIAGLAEEIRGLVAGRGSAARYGGEEFMAFLPNVSLQEAVALAELLRVSFANRDWHQDELNRNVTTSCGVSAVRDGETTLDSAIDRADCALYAAKSAGRNRVMAEITRAADLRDSRNLPVLAQSIDTTRNGAAA
ncbi:MULTISPECIES: GGDEF domain-containing protein [unclassified Sinorhizobium]|uniref:GGDEF domain-containing protein n=1 Tax=unclassified Sinorhizobium TaxID=2613772 RepID=UPI0024C2CFDD|nr:MULTISPECIES: GGDEF domain-containing protein [unclassified Sinorhizobium]MDK1376818.1 GGDEF domain-containing protein [Sinorhizobium sp. 6-70]MDK1481081.1 GGDEF domain-containing protein [Sinorhizobium sp. 6-117]